MMRGILRYESRADGGPMQTSSPANRTWSDSRSASEYTATVCTPSSRHARMTRSAISPRLAIRTFLNTGPPSVGHALDLLRDLLQHHGTSRSPMRGFASRACRVMGQDCESDSKSDQLLSLVPATPCTRSANSLGLVAKKTALS